MKISEGLRTEMERLQKSGCFALGQKLKRELSDLSAKHCVNPLVNLSCNACVKRTMWELIAKLNEAEQMPKLQKLKENPKKKMKMVKRLEDLSWAEIRQRAKDKGIKIYGKKKTELIQILKEQ